MVQSFPKHPTFRNRSYLPQDVTAYANDSAAGQRFALYKPPNPPSFYGWGGGYPTYLHLLNNGFNDSEGTFADASDKLLDGTGAAPDETEIARQLVERGFVAALAQTSATINGSALYATEGYWKQPGHADGDWENKAAAMAEKDAIMAIQHLRFHKDFYELNGRVAVHGRSAGAMMAGHLAYGPNWRGGLGQGGQYEMSTRPNVQLALFAQFPSWKPFDPTTGALHYEGVAVPGAPATALTDVTAADLRASEIINFCPFWGTETRRAVPTFFWTNQGLTSTVRSLGEPFLTGTEILAHSAIGGLILRNHFAEHRLMLPASVLSSNAGLAAATATNPAGAYNRLVDGLVTDIYGGGTDAADFIVAHINDEELDLRRGDDPWHYTGSVNTTVRQIVPREARGRVRVLKVMCTHTTNALRIGPAPDRAKEYVYPDGIGVVKRTAGPLYAVTDAATPSDFLVDESFEV